MRRNTRANPIAWTTVVAVSALMLGAAPAHAAVPPSAAVLVAPTDDSTVEPGSPLSVTVADPDSGSLEVTFHAAERQAGAVPSAGAPFTFLTIPDTQGYVITPTYTPVLDAQLRWVAANKERLNLGFVTGLGDIVDNQTSAAQWSRASTTMSILDDGKVPYAVLPGNHDFELATGKFAGYDANFPVSRFRDASWNSSSARYGGYYGQSEFGTDPEDRRNMSNYSLFTAGGMQFLLLNLELNAPDPVLAWARRVLDAHPEHRAIVATHSYLFTSGNLANQVLRTDTPGNSGAQIFQKLVSPSCNVFLVVNGHFSDGVDGEANRVDRNACGEPVYSALTDFQGRGSGGDGWLRYYTFTPSENTITATTYSPSRNEFETDGDSSFTMPYDMTQPTELPAIGKVTVTPGGTASVPIPEVPDGAVVDWYVVADDGTAQTRSQTWSATVSKSPPVEALAVDAFSRTVAAGWGDADTGGAWTVNSTSKLTVNGSAGRMASNAGSTLTATLGAVNVQDADLAVDFTIDRIPTQWMGISASLRQTSANSYSTRARVLPNSTIVLELLRNTSVLASRTIPGLTAAPDVPLHLRIQAEGTNPTELRARIWQEGTAEPSTWQVAGTDTTPALQAPGAIRLTSYLSSTATNGPVSLTWDNLTATHLP